jgi:hypothetical protein
LPQNLHTTFSVSGKLPTQTQNFIGNDLTSQMPFPGSNSPSKSTVPLYPTGLYNFNNSNNMNFGQMGANNTFANQPQTNSTQGIVNMAGFPQGTASFYGGIYPATTQPSLYPTPDLQRLNRSQFANQSGQNFAPNPYPYPGMIGNYSNAYFGRGGSHSSHSSHLKNKQDQEDEYEEDSEPSEDPSEHPATPPDEFDISSSESDVDDEIEHTDLAAYGHNDTDWKPTKNVKREGYSMDTENRVLPWVLLFHLFSLIFVFSLI